MNGASFAGLSALWWDTLVRVTLEGTLALSLAWLICAVFGRRAPGACCWVWRLAFLRTLVSIWWVSPVDIPLLGAAHRPLQNSSREFAAALSSPFGAAGSVPHLVHAKQLLPVSLCLLCLCLLWALGVSCFLLQAAGAYRAVRRLRKRSWPVQDRGLLERYAVLARRCGLRTAPALLQSAEAGSPVLIGGTRPAIILPDTALEEYTSSEMETVLAHELSHARRRDLPWSWPALLVTRLLFFHPFAWMALREQLLMQEVAADQDALALTASPAAEYARLVLRIAVQPGLPIRAFPGAASVAGSLQTLQRRLAALRGPDYARRRRQASLALLVAALALAVGGPWRLTHPSSQPSSPIGTVRLHSIRIQADSTGVRWKWVVTGKRRWIGFGARGFDRVWLSHTLPAFLPLPFGYCQFEVGLEMIPGPAGPGRSHLWRELHFGAVNGKGMAKLYGEEMHSHPGSVMQRVHVLAVSDVTLPIPSRVELASVDGKPIVLEIRS